MYVYIYIYVHTNEQNLCYGKVKLESYRLLLFRENEIDHLASKEKDLPCVPID